MTTKMEGMEHSEVHYFQRYVFSFLSLHTQCSLRFNSLFLFHYLKINGSDADNSLLGIATIIMVSLQQCIGVKKDFSQKL